MSRQKAKCRPAIARASTCKAEWPSSAAQCLPQTTPELLIKNMTPPSKLSTGDTQTQQQPHTTPSGAPCSCLGSSGSSVRSFEPQLAHTYSQCQARAQPSSPCVLRRLQPANTKKLLSFAACFLAHEHEGMQNDRLNHLWEADGSCQLTPKCWF